MLARLNHSRSLRYVGLYTWAVISVPLMYLGIAPGEDGQLLWHSWLAYGAFGVCYAWLTRRLGSRRPNPLDFAFLVAMTTSAIAVSYYSGTGLGSLLLMIAACVLPWLLSVRLGVAWMLLSQLAIVPVFARLDLSWFEAVMQSLLYAGFAAYVYRLGQITLQEAQAGDELRRLNTELRATRALLAESVRINERTRISRELHDLLGHHLTALSLNLEVANHLATGKAQEHVSQAHTLAKLLLSDVREAVSRIRENDGIDMAATLLPLADRVPGLRIDMRLPEPFLLDDPERAHVLLRCTQEIITNAVRHAQANTLDLRYWWEGGGIRLQAKDDGRGANGPAAGNGLRGMRERLAAYGGGVEIDTRPGEGFSLSLFLPADPADPVVGAGLPLRPIAGGQGGTTSAAA